MLNAMRKTAGTWVVRIFLVILIGSFAVWGIGDFVRGSIDTSIAKVGDSKISDQEFSEQFKRDLQRVQSQLGTSLTGEQARALGLHEQTLRTLVGRHLLDKEAERLGILVTDESLAQAIRENPAFRGATGGFDRLTYENMVRNQGWSTTRFESLLRQDLVREDIAGSVVAGVRPIPKILIDRLQAYRGEKREAEIAFIEDKAEIPAPDDETLKKFHEQNAARFTAPETRSFSFFTLEPKDLMEEAALTDAEVREEYEARKASYSEPERRQVEQIVYPDQAAADAAYEKLKDGGNYAAVAKETRGIEGADLSLGLLTREELPAELSEPAFALESGGISKPVQSPLGWHILRVTEIKPAYQKTFEEMKDTIAGDLKLQRATDLLYKTGTILQDEIAGGSTIEQAAAKVHAKVVKVPAMDARGRGPDGKAIADLPLYREFLGAVWDAPIGGEAEMREMAEGAYLVVKVDGSTPAALRPLDGIRADVIKAWTADQHRAKAEATAKSIADGVKAGGDFAALVEKAGSSLRPSGQFLRDGTGADRALLGGAIAAQLFDARPGDTVSAAAGDGQSAVVARLTAIVPADTTDAAARERLANEVAGSYGDDLALLFRQALEKNYGVSVNQANLDRIN